MNNPSTEFLLKEEIISKITALTTIMRIGGELIKNSPPRDSPPRDSLHQESPPRDSIKKSGSRSLIYSTPERKSSNMDWSVESPSWSEKPELNDVIDNIPLSTESTSGQIIRESSESIQRIPGGLAPEVDPLDTAEPIGSALAGAFERLQVIPVSTELISDPILVELINKVHILNVFLEYFEIVASSTIKKNIVEKLQGKKLISTENLKMRCPDKKKRNLYNASQAYIILDNLFNIEFWEHYSTMPTVLWNSSIDSVQSNDLKIHCSLEYDEFKDRLSNFKKELDKSKELV
jgi:hypothetical protein